MTKISKTELARRAITTTLELRADLAVHEDWDYVCRVVRDRCIGLEAEMLEAIRATRDGYRDLEFVGEPEATEGELN